MQHFDPNYVGEEGSGIYGMNCPAEEAGVILLPVAFEATTSYGGGASKAPKAILKASYQVDMVDGDLGTFFEGGFHLLPLEKKIDRWNREAMKLAKPIIKKSGLKLTAKERRALAVVNAMTETLHNGVEKECEKWLSQGKIVCVLGGDHSTPLGSIRAHARKYPHMGILHIDAHCDLREAFEGFRYSHASIMWNVLEETNIKTLVQVGIRDFSQSEQSYIKKSNKNIIQFHDQVLSTRLFQGEPWDDVCRDIVKKLPRDVYISFDIDALERSNCPGTGTPVPGGFTFQQVVHLLKVLTLEKKRIVGFDLVEVSPQSTTEWNENVGARMLFKLIGWTLASRKRHAR